MKLIDDIPKLEQITEYPDTSGDYVFVPGKVLKERELRAGLITMIQSTMPTPKRPEADKQWLVMLDGVDHLEVFPNSWIEIDHYGQGIPANVWCGVSRPEDAARLRTVRARRLFLRLPNEQFPESLTEHLGAWRCYNCGTRGESPKPERCPSGSICLGKERYLGPQIHWIWVP